MTDQDTILIVDDDPSLRQVLGALLQEEGFNVLRAADGIECLSMAYKHHPNLVLLDILMPNQDGREVCKRLREICDVPIIMLTAISAEKEKVERLKDGADDYVTKPFDNDELVARIRAVLRRTRQDSASVLRNYEDGFLQIDFEGHQLRVQGGLVALSPKEWRMLEYFVKNHDRLVTRQALLHHGWGKNYGNEYNHLKVLISHLRRKLRDQARHPRYIHTERDSGYRFVSHARTR